MCETELTKSSERTIRIRLGDEATEDVRRRVERVHRALSGARIAGVLDVTPAFAVVQVELDPLVIDMELAEERVRTLVRSALASTGGDSGAAARTVVVPVCYEGEFAPDLEFVAAQGGVGVEEAAAMHAAAEYRVCFLGFSPGFGYLSGLPEKLWAARLDSPRARVPAGSVGIAGSQTGVYPQATPGGWRIVGRTPLRMFDAMRSESPALLAVGDAVRFRRITREEFDAISASGEG